MGGNERKGRRNDPGRRPLKLLRIHGRGFINRFRIKIQQTRDTAHPCRFHRAGG